MKEKKKILSPFKRKLVVDNQEWSWQIEGRGSCLRICNPTRTQKYKIRISQSAYNDCDCGHCGDCLWGIVNPVTPSKMEKFIRENSKDNFKKVIGDYQTL